jgi:hypothetical protein
MDCSGILKFRLAKRPTLTAINANGKSSKALPKTQPRLSPRLLLAASPAKGMTQNAKITPRASRAASREVLADARSPGVSSAGAAERNWRFRIINVESLCD